MKLQIAVPRASLIFQKDLQMLLVAKEGGKQLAHRALRHIYKHPSKI